MDVITMASVVQNGLIQRDRIFTVSVLLPDKPGELVRVSQVIAEEKGNVIKLDHNQFFSINGMRRWSCGLQWKHSAQIIKIRLSVRWSRRDLRRSWCVRTCKQPFSRLNCYAA